MLLLHLGKLSFPGWSPPLPSTLMTHNTAQAQKLAFGDDSPSDGDTTTLENHEGDNAPCHRWPFGFPLPCRLPLHQEEND